MREPIRRIKYKSRFTALPPLLCACLFFAIALQGCQNTKRADMTALDRADMSFNSVDELRQAQLTDAEVQQLALARQAGLSDDGCVELVRIAHSRKQLFVDGQVVAGLEDAGLREASILTLARLNLLDSWAGEAQAMRLANLSDSIILAVARRRAARESVLSGEKVAELRNAGLSEQEIMGYVEQGITDNQADELIARRNDLAGGHSFVHESGRRR